VKQLVDESESTAATELWILETEHDSLGAMPWVTLNGDLGVPAGTDVSLYQAHDLLWMIFCVHRDYLHSILLYLRYLANLLQNVR
jgi:hypothetical protein